MNHLKTITVVMVICIAATLGACKRVRAYIPMQDTAAEQYDYAVNYRLKNDLKLRNRRDLQKVRDIREAVRQTFSKVEEVFPEDRKVTPLARLQLAEMKALLDVNTLNASRWELRSAIRDLQDIREAYPDYDYIQAKALYDEGLCWRELKKFVRAQERFREVTETFSDHDNDKIRNLAQRASRLYNRTYIQ